MPDFIPGLDLNERFYHEAVEPLVKAYFPNLQYAAALIGPGSEVNGFDTAMSMDHDWGLHFFLFVKDEDEDQCQPLADMLSHKLPATFAGFPVAISQKSPKPAVRVLEEALTGPILHHITPITLRKFCYRHLGHDVMRSLDVTDWLALAPHAIGETVHGRIFHDGTGELTELRRRLHWYPRDVWLYLLAAGWARIGEEEHLMPRAGYVGSELGSSLIGSRLVRDVMNLCYLMEQQYAPYAKWFGMGFCRLKCGQTLEPMLWAAQRAATWEERQQALARAYEVLAEMHNGLGIGRQMPTVCSGFYDRPFQVIHGETFAESLKDEIRDPVLRGLARDSLVGGVAQWTDSCAVLERLAFERVRSLYG